MDAFQAAQAGLGWLTEKYGELPYPIRWGLGTGVNALQVPQQTAFGGIDAFQKGGGPIETLRGAANYGGSAIDAIPFERKPILPPLDYGKLREQAGADFGGLNPLVDFAGNVAVDPLNLPLGGAGKLATGAIGRLGRGAEHAIETLRPAERATETLGDITKARNVVPTVDAARQFGEAGVPNTATELPKHPQYGTSFELSGPNVPESQRVQFAGMSTLGDAPKPSGGGAAPVDGGKLESLIPDGFATYNLRDSYRLAKERGMVSNLDEWNQLLTKELDEGTILGGGSRVAGWIRGRKNELGVPERGVTGYIQRVTPVPDAERLDNAAGRIAMHQNNPDEANKSMAVVKHILDDPETDPTLKAHFYDAQASPEFHEVLGERYRQTVGWSDTERLSQALGTTPESLINRHKKGGVLNVEEMALIAQTANRLHNDVKGRYNNWHKAGELDAILGYGPNGGTGDPERQYQILKDMVMTYQLRAVSTGQASVYGRGLNYVKKIIKDAGNNDFSPTMSEDARRFRKRQSAEEAVDAVCAQGAAG